MKIAIAHDYLTQRGGAERVVMSLLSAFPDASVYTSLYDPDETFPAFRAVDVRTLSLQRIAVLRRNHRLALPLLAPAFSQLRVDADVVLCSSSGWSHGVRTSGKKIVYCHSPARWLYQTDRYVASGAKWKRAMQAAMVLLRRPLMRWDQRAAATADRYLANSNVVRDRIREIYGLDADVVPPPPRLTPAGRHQPVEGVEPGFMLCVSRLLPYKNITAVVRSFEGLAHSRLVLVGTGPQEKRIRDSAGANVCLLGSVSEAKLRWLYANCSGLVAASYEDFGLTPLEAAAFGKPAAVLRWGGFLDTVVEDETGVFFDRPEPAAVVDAVQRLLRANWDNNRLRAHAALYAEERFVARVQGIVAEEVTRGPSPGTRRSVPQAAKSCSK